MDSFKAIKRHLVLQQRWVKLCCAAVVLVTLVSLLLGSLGTDSAQLRSTGMGAFTEEDIGKYNLGHHVDNLKEAGSRIVKSLWWWSDDDEEDFIEAIAEQEAQEEAAAGDTYSGEGWNEQDQAELDAFVPEQGQGGGEWQGEQQQEWVPTEEAWSQDAPASAEQAWQQEPGSAEQWPAEQGADPETQSWEQSAESVDSAEWATRADAGGSAEWPAEEAEWAAETEPAKVVEWAAEGIAPDEQREAESAAEAGNAKASEVWEDPKAWAGPEPWEEARESQTEQQPSAADGSVWYDTADGPETKDANTWEAESEKKQTEDSSKTTEEDAWRDEEQWAGESQPSGPYKEEQHAEIAEGSKAHESALTHTGAGSTADEQLWEERPQWEEPATKWEASAEQASSGATDYRQEWPSDGAAAAEEWYDSGAVRDPVMDDTDSTEQPSQEWKEDAAVWNAAEDGK